MNIELLKTINDGDYISEIIAKVISVEKKSGTGKRGNWNMTKFKIQDNSGPNATYITIWKNIDIYTQKWYKFTNLKVEVYGKWRNLIGTKNTTISDSQEPMRESNSYRNNQIPNVKSEYNQTRNVKPANFQINLGNIERSLEKIANTLDYLVTIKKEEIAFHPNDTTEDQIKMEFGDPPDYNDLVEVNENNKGGD